jgi:hypothetical protein
MARVLFFTVTVVLLLSGLGCKSDTPPLESSALKGKLDAAMVIRDGIKHDDALLVVAEEAGRLGDVGVAEKAVREIRDGIKHDDAASKAAVALAAIGNTSSAKSLAEMIRDGVKRDNALSKIAATP